MKDRTELLERFRKGPELVAAVMTGAAGAEVDWAPEGKWSIRQILAHLADSEIVGADRLRRTVAEPNPTLIWYDQDAWAANLNYPKRKPSESLDLLRRLRADNYELVKDLPDAAFDRTATHSQRGTLTLAELVELNAAHVEAHARQIREVRDRFKAEGVRKA
jgi:hypothetical protein